MDSLCFSKKNNFVIESLSIVTESGMTNCFKLLHPLKAYCPSDFILLSKDKVFKELQLLKHFHQCYYQLFMSTDTRLAHPLKALLPISLAFFMSTDTRLAHPLKASLPILPSISMYAFFIFAHL